MGPTLLFLFCFLFFSKLAQPSLFYTCACAFWTHPSFKLIKVNSTCRPEAFPAKHTGAAATWQHSLCNQDIDFPKLASHIAGAWNMLRDSDEHGLDLISKHRAPQIPHQSPAEVSKASRRQQADYLPKWKCVCVCCHHGSLAACPCGDQRSLTHTHTHTHTRTHTCRHTHPCLRANRHQWPVLNSSLLPHSLISTLRCFLSSRRDLLRKHNILSPLEHFLQLFGTSPKNNEASTLCENKTEKLITKYHPA